MTAPMTRERLAELRRTAPFPGGACDVSNYDELVDACEALLTERDWYKRQRDDALKRARDARVEMGQARAELARLKKEMAGVRDAAWAEGITEAANYIWFSDDRSVPNMDTSEHIRRALARELRQKALKGKR